MDVKQQRWRAFTKSWVWLLIGCALIGFAISTAASIQENHRTEVLYSYGAVVLTLLIVLGVLLIIFRSGIVSLFLRKD